MIIEEAVVARGSKEDQSARTCAALIEAAHSLFAERGYAATGTEEIVQAAGVTRGALYHHFVDKQDLFEAVYTNLQNDLRDRIVAAARADSTAGTWERIRRGVHEYLDHSMEPTVQRIVLVEAPAVFGWQRWREIDSEYALGLLKGAMVAARDEGLLIAGDPDTLAHLMLGVVSEASQVIADAADVAAARLEVGCDVDRLLDSLRAV
ncbi:MAG: helix-turn-helix domain containing protein [Chloroflexi bacterium]|nr:helix-turn-helix domain containing protein [Chloroflexota bacterium]